MSNKQDELVIEYTKKIDFEAKIPNNCPICSIFMKTMIDNQAYALYQCCSKCYVQFIECDVKRWKAGWRPSEKEIETFLKKFKPIAFTTKK